MHVWRTRLSEWLEESRWTNRLTLRDHWRLCHESRLAVRRFAGTTEFAYPFTPPAPLASADAAPRSEGSSASTPPHATG